MFARPADQRFLDFRSDYPAFRAGIKNKRYNLYGLEREKNENYLIFSQKLIILGSEK